MLLAFAFVVVIAHQTEAPEQMVPPANDAPATTSPPPEQPPATTSPPAADAPTTTTAPPVETPAATSPLPVEAPAATSPPAAVVVQPLWDDVPDELERAATGGVNVCEAASLPLSLIPGVGDAVGTVTEWLCLVPAAVAVDTVALQFGGRDATLWQAVVAVLAQKLFEDVIGAPLDLLVALALVGAVGALVGSVLIALYVIPGFPIFLPTLLAIGAGTLLIAPIEFVKHKGGEWIFQAVIMALTNRVYGDELRKKQKAGYEQPGPQDSKWSRAWILATAAAGSEAEDQPAHFIPVVGPVFKAADEGVVTKERMRRVGRDMLHDAPRDLANMDGTIDVLAGLKGATGAVGEGLAVTGLAVGITGALLPPLKAANQTTGDTVGFVGLGIAVVGLGIYELADTFDTIKVFAVPAAYGAFE